MDIVKQLLLQLVLILVNAFFAATEIALLSINEKKVKAQAEDGDKKAVKMLKIIEQPTKFLSTIQIGITLAGFLGSAFAADNFAERLSSFIVSSFGVAEAYVGIINTVSVIVITLLLSYFTLVLGELVPKRVAMKHKEKLASAFCGIISFLAVILKPIIWFLTISTNTVIRLFGIDPHAKEEAVSEEDVVLMLDSGADEGSLDKDDVEYIKNVFKLDGLTVADVMTPRTSVVKVSQDEKDEDIIKLIEEEAYSRMPVYDAESDKVIGVLYAREYLLKRDNKNFTLMDAVKEPIFVPETKHLDILFKEMQKEHTHIVIVVNEYGEFSGVVTMEDILEELVGDIWDEEDEAVEMIREEGEGVYSVQTGVSIDEFFTYFDLTEEEEIASTTLNGWIIEKCGDIPDKGYSIEKDNIIITVTKVDSIQTEEVRVEVVNKEESSEEEKEDNNNNNEE